jgi:hypothetical protein
MPSAGCRPGDGNLVAKHRPALRASELADPELSALHVAACDWHIAKIAELKAREGWPAFREQISQIDNGAAWREKQADD